MLWTPNSSSNRPVEVTVVGGIHGGGAPESSEQLSADLALGIKRLGMEGVNALIGNPLAVALGKRWAETLIDREALCWSDPLGTSAPPWEGLPIDIQRELAPDYVYDFPRLREQERIDYYELHRSKALIDLYREPSGRIILEAHNCFSPPGNYIVVPDMTSTFMLGAAAVMAEGMGGNVVVDDNVVFQKYRPSRSMVVDCDVSDKTTTSLDWWKGRLDVLTSMSLGDLHNYYVSNGKRLLRFYRVLGNYIGIRRAEELGLHEAKFAGFQELSLDIGRLALRALEDGDDPYPERYRDAYDNARVRSLADLPANLPPVRAGVWDGRCMGGNSVFGQLLIEIGDQAHHPITENGVVLVSFGVRPPTKGAYWFSGG